MLKSRFFALAIFAPIIALGCGEKSSTPAPSQTSATPKIESTIAPPSPEEIEIALKMAELPAPYNAANYDKGRKQFATCRSCHLLNEGGGHRVGPNLHGIFGQKIGKAEGFKYSTAIQEADFEWTPEKLDQWLTSPKDFLPGNRMTFAGIVNATQRENLIAYLMVETK